MKQQQGFTLIELVVVIVILGILAAVAVPRFINMQGDARFSVLQGAHGAVQSATALAHAQALAQGVTTGTITVEGQSINITNSYPDANSIVALLNLTPATDFSTTPAAPTTTVAIQMAKAGTPANCKIDYTETASVNTPPVIVVTGTGSNCL